MAEHPVVHWERIHHFHVGGESYPPEDVEFVLMPPEGGEPERVIEHSDLQNVSLDREPNVFGFPLLQGERFTEPPERDERRRWSEEWLRAVIREEIAAAAGEPIVRDIRPPKGV